MTRSFRRPTGGPSGSLGGGGSAGEAGGDGYPASGVGLNPRMHDGVLERDSLLRIGLQETADEVSRSARDVGREMEVDGLDASIGVHLRGAFEGRFADEELEGEDAERPMVDTFVVRFVLHHFRRQIVQRAAERFSSGRRGVDGPAEIGDLHLLAQAEQEIFRFDVAVNHLFRMTIDHRVEEFGHVSRRPRFVELSFGLQRFVELALGGKL